jgi:hypothetical protein
LLGKKILLAAIGLVILSVSLAVAEPPKDVEGWRQARWGMTESQILEAFKGEAIRLDKGEKYDDNVYASVGINNFYLNGLPFSVRFVMDDYSRVLKRINITLLDKRVSLSNFDDLKKMLIEKYGQPPLDNERKDSLTNDYETTWIFATTIIELKFAELRGLGMDKNLLKLFYRAKDKGDSDKL